MPPDRLADAIVIYANNAQFAAAQKIEYPHVESRMLVWCKAGKGLLTANNISVEFEPGQYLFLPWGHSIRYQASVTDPFFLGGIHLVPRHHRVGKVIYEVAHTSAHPLARANFRQDRKMPGLDGVKQGRFAPGDPLTLVAEYVVGVFLRGNPPEWLARQLARQLLHELTFAGHNREVYAAGEPPEVERIRQYIMFNLHRPLSLSHLVEFAKLSPSTIRRMFRDHLRTSPVTWILRAKIEKACTLLRTRRLSVAEVAEQVGIPDPHYFSKCFRQTTGQSPLEYRRKRQWL